MTILSGVPHVVPHRIHINGGDPAQIQLRARGATGQTANVLEVQNSAGTTLFSIDPDGDVTLTGSIDAVVNEVISGNLTLSGNFTVNGNTTLGNAAGDTVTVTGTATFTPSVTFTGGLTSNNLITLGGSTAISAESHQIGRNDNNHNQYNVPLTQQHIFSTGGVATMTVASTQVAINSPLVVAGRITANGGITSAGAVSFPDGTAALPSITFNSDLDTGFYRAAANQIGFSVGGAVELTLNATNLSPGVNDGLVLGVSGTAFSDLFLASGAIIDFAAGDFTITHSSNTLAFAGGVITHAYTLTDAITGFDMAFTTSGAGSAQRNGLIATLLAGSTTSGVTSVLTFDNRVAGVDTSYQTDVNYGSRPGGNRGIGGFSRGPVGATGTGHNIGGLFLASRGAVNWGTWAGATVALAAVSNIGVIGVGFNDAAGGEGIGVYALYDNPSAVPTIPADIKTALYANNSSNAVDIAIFADNGTAVWTLANGGGITQSGLISWTGAGVAITAASYQFGLDDSGTTLHGNVATGGSFEFSVNDVAELTLSATTLGLATNTITGIGTAITGTANTALTLSVPNQGANTNAGVGLNITADAGGSGTTGGAGGSITITAGDANGSGDNAGGDISLRPGIDTGAGAPGSIDLYGAGGAALKLQLSDYSVNDYLISADAGDITFFGIFAGPPTLDFAILRVASSANYLRVEGAAASAEPVLSAQGTDTDIDIKLAPKGAGNVVPTASDDSALGSTTLMWSDLFLASGAIINFNAGDVTLTHSVDTLTLGAGGFVINTPPVGIAGFNLSNGAGARTVAFSTITFDGTAGAAAGGTLFDINVSQTGAGANPLFDIDVSALYTGEILSAVIGAIAYASDIINIDLGNTQIAAQIAVLDAGDSARTTDAIQITDNTTSTGDVFAVSVAGAAASGAVFDIDVGAVLWAGDVLNLDLGATSTAGQLIVLTGGAVARTTHLIELNDAGTSTGIGFDINKTGGSYSTGFGYIDLVRSGNFTGVDTETAIDIRIAPSFTLTEPGGGTFTLYGMSIDLSGILVTAGVGTTVLACLNLVANADADVGTNLALRVGSGVSAFGGNITPLSDDGSAIGATGLKWADLFLASGSVINFNSGDVTITHAANLLTIESGDLAMGNDALIRRDVNAAITASTTQTQGNGPLTAEINEISVVANANDTVTLPSAVVGYRIVIINNGANTLRIFPASGDNLGAGVDTATTLGAGSNIIYQAYDATNWESI